MFLVVLLTKLFVLRGKNAGYEFIKLFLRSMGTAEKYEKTLSEKI